MGVERLRAGGVATAIVTGERSESVARRAEKLGIDHLVLGARDKRAALGQLLERTGLEPAEVAYIGDDLNDLPALELAARDGLTGAPADAMPEVLATVHHRCAAPGGHGAFRDFAEWILRLKGGHP
jgi:3-deoxy-D-manno-octulosonate 8-phosphate phosphatase (KDO 8-P phosphatase)